MIELNRLNGNAFLINILQIEQIESLPDTTITLLNGKKLVVKNDLSEVYTKINELYQYIGLGELHKEIGEKNEEE
ncbi:flagellar FlbD family protein [Alkalihalobacillus pseudalcaliphilus]|uniref:flagellar FlbD family protein n=1 Tax=Alkalihalobacillus pseudalcaliphilus TaxID=79884 RepID=UPI00064D7F59|nr:flagellar FlbD family protein [Alkalihalobacillus pseudalcaliphilus]KMK77223.1 flagellar protein FlbD [Alkalihalobacillus pseudalcaliphilus]